MRTNCKIILLAISTLGFAAAAHAADLKPLKAPAGAFYAGGTGWYGGLGASAAVAQSSVQGNNLFATSLATGSLMAAGGSVDGVLGYITPGWRIETSVSYQNIQGSTDLASNASASVASRWSASQEFDVSANLFANIMTAIGTTGLTNVINFPSFTPQLPANIAVATTPRQYFGAGLQEFGISGTFGAANGVAVGVDPFIKTGFIWQTVDSTGKLNGGAVDLFASVAFPLRGFTMGNAFSANGTPLTLGAGADLGTQYRTGIHYDFGI
jgi:hypothetical protein